MLPCVYKNGCEKGTFFLENACMELCVHKMGVKLGKIHTKWVIFWNNVNRKISLKKLHAKLVVWVIIAKKFNWLTKNEHNFNLKLKKEMFSFLNMERLCGMGGFEWEMNNFNLKQHYPVKNAWKCVVILKKNHTQNGQI